MMNYLVWRYTFLLFMWFRISESQEVVNCFGTNWQDTMVTNEDAATRYETMRQQFTGCTHVKGNVEITWQQNVSLDFSFLKDIQDVSGYVLVTKSYLPYIPLPKLAVIRGETLFKDNALYVSHNYNETSTRESIVMPNVGLLELRLVSLREILQGGVLIFENPGLCYATSIDWTDILANGSEYEVTYPFKECNECNLNCNTGCWGAGADMCQTLNKKVCNASCENRCFGPGGDKCCDVNCVGGCMATGPSNCIACRNFINGDKCVQSCPAGMVIDGRMCVLECRVGWTPVDGICVGHGIVTCQGNVGTGDYIYDENIQSFKNCEIVENNVIIQRETFIGMLFEGKIGISYEDLNALENIKVIKGFLIITDILKSDVEARSMLRLSFLKNLKEVHGSELKRGASITVRAVNTLKTLSLSSLKLVKKGNVIIENNQQLCLTNEQKWNSGLMDSEFQQIFISGNQNTQTCELEGYKCDDECLGGCWDVGIDSCFLCKDYELDGICTRVCNASRGEYVSDAINRICGHCHPQCDGTCTGPGPSDCLACKNVRDGEKCKEECPEFKYPNADKVCIPCHENCVLGCTGKSNLRVSGGCDNCYVTQIDLSGNEQCLPREVACDKHFYEIKTVAGARICRECDDICKTCASVPSNCTSCKLTSIDLKCVEDCGSNQFMNNGKCEYCHEECRSECKGPSAKDCNACANAVIEFKGGVYECVRSCPKDLKEGVCNDRCNTTPVGLLVGFAVVVFFIIVLFILVLYCYFSRKRESKKYHDATVVSYKGSHLKRENQKEMPYTKQVDL